MISEKLYFFEDIYYKSYFLEDTQNELREGTYLELFMCLFKINYVPTQIL